MQMHPIEIDSEVLAFLRERIEDFNETPNSVLRRELRLIARSNPPVDSSTIWSAKQSPPTPTMADIPLSAPEALSQILEVVQLVRGSGMDRIHATIRVAERRRIERETVADKYGRQMELSTEQFDGLLAELELHELRQRLCAKFPRYQREITEAISKLAKE